MEIEMDAMDISSSADSLAVLMASGVPEIKFDEEGTFTLTISEDDPEDVKDIKKSVEFTINTAQEMIAVLKRFAVQTGNAKFFDSINSFLLTINGSIGKLVDMKKASQAMKALPKADQIIQTNIQNNFSEPVNTEVKPMTAKEALKLAMNSQPEIIDVTPKGESS
ncbi:terminase small subunit [Agrobacterium phage OLIVR5]|uniref:Terminase small subunit n=1 Tax=Agrobacterium phage OLIVR5 TaxID=2723773 RepID=A0A858MV16_9CAUD|nr:terminase small subunit [Agrobacterium phage OLIVR5]QIW87780.1 terminase small subunit [Agrobacterium phage OLIVR5]QIW88044.1 terminase small subunit [Agrobacterium phage OLIVR6]